MVSRVHLEGRILRIVNTNKERLSDQNVNDVIMTPNGLENICLYETQMWIEIINLTATTRKKTKKRKKNKQ